MLLVPRIAWVIYMCSYFSLRPFLTRIVFQEIWGWRGQQFLREKKTFLTRKFSGKISSPKIPSGNFGSNSPSRGNFEAQNFLETRGNFTRKFYEEILGSLDNRTEISSLSQYWMLPTTYTQLMCSLLYSHMHRFTQTLPQEP